MNTTAKKLILLLLPLLICAVNMASGQPVFPVKVSENGRYIVDSNNISKSFCKVFYRNHVAIIK